MKKLLIFLTITLALFANSDRALQIIKEQKALNRTALVIGNSSYKHISELKNTLNDARAMKRKLEDKGFDVVYVENATLEKMDDALTKFSFKLSKGGVGLFYFSGHGLQYQGDNYLVPIDFKLRKDSDIKYKAFAANQIVDEMESANNPLNILILDACRNDPSKRSTGGGLAAINNARGMYIAFATAPGDVASDGVAGGNSPYTKALINEMDRPQKIEEMFKNVGIKVENETNGSQNPWTNSSLRGDFYFTIPDGNINYQKPQRQSSFSFESNKPTTYSLTINTTPSNAKIEILNSFNQYYRGIQLSSGQYEVKVSSDGYYSKTGKIDFHSDMNLNIDLDEKPVEQNIIKDKYGNIYKTVTSPYTGKVWLDRNLGAKRVCQSYDDEKCFGDYFQWGRGADGHEKRYSSTTTSLSYFDSPDNSDFILVDGSNDEDWRMGHNGNLWQGVNGKNNPCPKGFRVPTIDELQIETVYKDVKNYKDAYYNFLKIPSNGVRSGWDKGKIKLVGSESLIWSSSLNRNNKDAYNLLFKQNKAYEYDDSYRSMGIAVRCIKD